MQKLMFLLDRKLTFALNGPHFNFFPYDYGPFDRAVYDALSELERKGQVETIPVDGWRGKKYRTTPEGQKAGEALLASLSDPTRNAVEQLSRFVRRLSFSELVSSIYGAYPEMKANSVFRD
jgi:hypothetical protein